MLSDNASRVLWVSVAVGSILGLGSITNALFPDAFSSITNTIKAATGNYSGDQNYDANAPTAESTDYTYSYNGQFATVTGLKMGLGADKKYPTAVIPEKINYGGKTYTINAIGDNAFSNNKSGYQITSVTLPDTVTSIGAWAFAYNKLTTAPLSNASKNNITSLSQGAFAYNQLTKVVVPDSVTTIGTMVFENNNISSFTWSKNLSTIPDQTFMNNKLKDVSAIPDTVTALGDYAFQKNSITSLSIGSNIKAIGNYAFGDNNLATLTVPSTVTSIGGGAFSSNALTSLNIANSTKNTGYGAYSDNKLQSVAIPATWSTIPSSIFENNKITALTIPSTVSEIGSNAFSNNSIKNLTIPNTVKTIDEYGFQNAGIQTLSIGSGLSEISDYAFDSNMISTLAVPDNIKSIGSSAFEDNDIENLTFNKKTSNLSVIGDRAFYGNMIQNQAGSTDFDQYTQNVSYDLPAGNQTQGITTETSDGLVFPDSLTSIGDQAFADSQNDSSLSNSQWAVIKFDAGLTKIGKNAFSSFTNSNDSNATLTILFEVKQQSWALVQNQTLEIDDGAFANNIMSNHSNQDTPSQTVRFPDYVSSIGANVITDNPDASSNNENISVYSDTNVDSSAFSSDYKTVTRPATSSSKSLDSALLVNQSLAYIEAWAK